jgi:hypothetical protein
MTTGNWEQCKNAITTKAKTPHEVRNTARSSSSRKKNLTLMSDKGKRLTNRNRFVLSLLKSLEFENDERLV